MAFEVITEGLEFPEGPIAMQDGSVIVTEVAAGRITRVLPDGRKEHIASPGGGPNGMAIGPDGALYVCNNGGMVCQKSNGIMTTTGEAVPEYETGRIERVDFSTGKIERLYAEVDGRRLAGPNDIVFDTQGGFWFSDLGKRRGHISEAGGIFYAKADGTGVTRVLDRVGGNGIGLSPDGLTLYVAVSHARQMVAYDLSGPGQIDPSNRAGRIIASFPGRQLLDSLAITSAGQICVAAVYDNPGIASIDPETGKHHIFSTPDPLPTNICFGGGDMTDAWITLSGTGRLIRTCWHEPGLRLAFNR